MQGKRKQRSSIIRLLAQGGILFIGIYLAMGLVFNELAIDAKQQELDALNAQLVAQQQQNDEASRILESGSDLEIIERVARNKRNYAKPNERVFVDITGK